MQIRIKRYCIVNNKVLRPGLHKVNMMGERGPGIDGLVAKEAIKQGFATLDKNPRDDKAIRGAEETPTETGASENK